MKKSQILALILMLFAFSHSQCITVRQRTARHPFVHYSALILCTFSLFRCGNLYFFMFHFFYVALFSYCTISMLHFFCVVIFLCWTFFFVFHSFYVLLYSMLHFYTLQCFRVTFFSCCTLSML